MKKYLFLLCLGFCLLGGQALYTNLTNLKPVDITLSELISAGAPQKWVQITELSLDVMDSTYITSSLNEDEATDLYIPMYVPETPKERIQIFLHSQDPELLQIFNEMLAKEDETEVMKHFLEHRNQLMQQRSVSGLIRFGLESNQEDRDILKEHNPNLAEDFLILNENQRPNWVKAAMLPLGLFLLWVLFFRRARD